jgi:hypothetical protein
MSCVSSCVLVGSRGPPEVTTATRATKRWTEKGSETSTKIGRRLERLLSVLSYAGRVVRSFRCNGQDVEAAKRHGDVAFKQMMRGMLYSGPADKQPECHDKPAGFHFYTVIPVVSSSLPLGYLRRVWIPWVPRRQQTFYTSSALRIKSWPVLKYVVHATREARYLKIVVASWPKIEINLLILFL